MLEYNKILIGYPSESGSIKNLENGLLFGKIMDAQIDVVYISEPLKDSIYYWNVGEGEIFPTDYWSEARNETLKGFKKDLKTLEERLGLNANLKEVEGNPAQTIIKMSANYSLVIIDAGKEDEKAKNHLSPTARNVVHSARRPVLILRKQHDGNGIDAIKNILVPVDGSRVSNFAVAHAFYIANKVNGTITLLHVWEKKYEKGLRKLTRDNIDIKKIKEQICKLIFDETESTMITKTQVKREVIEGEPSDVIESESGKYDLIVMGTHGRSGIKEFLLGSNAENVAQHVQNHVLLVRGISD